MRDHCTPSSDCPYCRTPLDAALNTEGRRAPRPGDMTLCLLCAGLCVFGDDLALRFPTDDELAACAHNPHLARVRAALLETHRRLGPPPGQS